MNPTPAEQAVPSLSIGPIAYYWPRADVLRFYAEMAAMSVARIYLGETVCSRRHEMRAQDWLVIARELAAAGKQVVLSSQTLIESMADVRALESLAGNTGFTIEANDMSAVALLAGRTNFVAGPYLNLHSPDTLEWISGLGATRWVAPPDLTGAQVASLLATRPAGLETEVLIHGRLPLAFSARCFTARHFNLAKEDCQFRCIEHPDGLPLATRDGVLFLTLNGIQTQSAAVHSLLAELPALHALGVDALRISPQATRNGRGDRRVRQGARRPLRHRRDCRGPRTVVPGEALQRLLARRGRHALDRGCGMIDLPALPGPLRELIGRLPPLPHSAALCLVLNRVLAPQLPPDIAAALEGRRFALHESLSGVAFHFTVHGGRFRPAIAVDREPDLVLRATAPDYWKLATRQEDPDTLFFTRRLKLEGETELGLLVKNTLDALEPFDPGSLLPALWRSPKG